MSLGIAPAIIHQATSPTGNDKGSWTSLFSSYATSSIIGGGWGSSCQKRSLPLFDEPMKHYEDMIMESDSLRPSLLLGAQIVVEVSNWLSLLGSLAIILHVPHVVKQVPAQRTRMLIILFTAFSNLGFAISNVVTGTRLTSSWTRLSGEASSKYCMEPSCVRPSDTIHCQCD